MTKTSIRLFAAGIVSLLALGTAKLADADARSRQKNLDKAAARAGYSPVGELHRDRAELRRDQAELERDRIDLRRLHRSGASREEIIRKRQEIAGGLREIEQGRREIRDDLGALRRNRDHQGGGWSDDRWRRDDNNRWGWGSHDNDGSRWGRDRRDNRGRWNNHERFGRGYGRN